MSQANPKKGGNKGIARDHKLRKRAEAEARNERTPLERTRAYRRRIETGVDSHPPTRPQGDTSRRKEDATP